MPACLARAHDAEDSAAAYDVHTETAAADWDQFVAAEPTASGYHEWAWRGVFTRAFGHEAIYLSARSGGRIHGVLPLVLIDSWMFGRSLISLPFLNYGGVVAAGERAAAALLERAAAIAAERRCRHLELRHVQQRFPQLPCKQHKVGMWLNLGTDVPAVWEGLDRKVRNQIRKAQKSGLTTAIGGVELLDEFYGVFARNMRDLGTPVYARVFFEDVLMTFPGRARIHVVRLGPRTVAAGITFQTRRTVEVPWASSLREHNALCPNHLLYWSVIEASIGRGGTLLDFGRSTPDEGTFKFKRQWGAEPVPLHWEYHLPGGGALPNTSPTNPKFSMAIALWKRLPLPVTTAIGPAIVRSIP
jgi:FemAB-related protein (PEP-CTERM system-associated)